MELNVAMLYVSCDAENPDGESWTPVDARRRRKKSSTSSAPARTKKKRHEKKVSMVVSTKLGRFQDLYNFA